MEGISERVLPVVDVSGSMNGVSIEQAKKGLQYSVSQLNNNDLFNMSGSDDDGEEDEIAAAKLELRQRVPDQTVKEAVGDGNDDRNQHGVEEPA